MARLHLITLDDPSIDAASSMADLVTAINAQLAVDPNGGSAVTVAEELVEGMPTGRLVFNDTESRDFSDENFSLTNAGTPNLPSTATVTANTLTDMVFLSITLGGELVALDHPSIGAATTLAELITAINEQLAINANAGQAVTVSEELVQGTPTGHLLFTDTAFRDFTDANFAVLNSSMLPLEGGAFTDGALGQAAVAATDLPGSTFTDGVTGSAAVAPLALAGATFMDGDAGSAAIATDSFSKIAALDTLSNFLIGTDKVDLLTAAGDEVAAPTSLTRVNDVPTSDDLSEALAYAFAALEPNQAGLVVISAGTAAGTYLYADNGNGEVNATEDVFVKLAGVVPGSIGALTVSDYFA